MALQDGYLYHVVGAIGLEKDIPTNFTTGEIGFVTDRVEMIVGDGSTVPARIPTDKTLGAFSFASLSQLTLPSGLVVQASKPGSIGAITPSRMTAGQGLLSYRGLDASGQDAWANAYLTSSDSTLLLTNPNGVTASAIDLRLNPNSSVLQNLIKNLIGSSFTGTNGIAVDGVNGVIKSTLGLGIRTARNSVNPTADKVDIYNAADGTCEEITPYNLLASVLTSDGTITFSQNGSGQLVLTGAASSGGSGTPQQTIVAPGVKNVFIATNNTSAVAGQVSYILSNWIGVQTTFSTSTFDGQTFTVGGGEAGYAYISANINIDRFAASMTADIFVNGVQSGIGTSITDSTGQQYNSQVSIGGNLFLNVGDKVTVRSLVYTVQGGGRNLTNSKFGIVILK